MPVRSGAYSGPSKLAVPFPGAADDAGPGKDPQTPSRGPTPEPGEGEDPTPQPADAAGPSPAAARRAPGWTSPVHGGDASGFLLGLLTWGWVVLPYLQGGTAKVKAVWMAKFLNKASDGSALP